MTKQFPVPEEQHGLSELSQGPVPADLGTRVELIRARIPEMLRQQTVVDDVPAPDVSAAASIVSAAETFDMTDLPELEILVNDYPYAKRSAGRAGVLESGEGPALATTDTSNDQMNINIAGDGAQAIDIGTTAGGVAVAAAIEAAVQGLTANDDRNQEAFDSFAAEYIPPSFSTALAVALSNGVDVNILQLDTLQGLKRGDTLRIVGASANIDAKVIDLFKMGRDRRVQIETITPGEDIPVDSVVYKPDDKYRFTTGKRGADMTIVFTDGAANGADDLLLRVQDGAVSTLGLDAVGPQVVKFVDADFVSNAAATAEEIAAAINKVLTGAQANVTDAGTTVTIITDRVGADAKLLISGDARAVLGYSADEEVGTETEVAVSLDGARVLYIQPYISASGVLLDMLADPVGDGLVRVRRDALVNLSTSVDYSNSGANRWKVFLAPGV